MSRSPNSTRPRGDRRTFGAAVAVVALLAGLLGFWQPAASADVAPTQVDLRVLVISDGSNWAEGFKTRLDQEGIPHTDVNLWDGSRPIIAAGFLSSGTEAFYQAVFTPNGTAGNLPDAELTALRDYEAKFGVREVDGYLFPTVNDGAFGATWTGPYEGKTATVTAAGKANGFGYLNGPVVYGPGSFTYLANALTPTSSPALAPGDQFTTLVSGTADGASGSIIGVFSHAGVERMIITSAFANALYQYQVFAHGIISWATHGVHLGYNRNYFTMHVDDAFSSDNTWDVDHNCTPGEDCPIDANGDSIYPELPIRMSPEDVAHAAQWSAANDYELTLAFNGFYADAAADPLTQAFQAQKTAFRWLNHGLEHIYQGCVQDFTVIPWRCKTDTAGNILWVSQAAISNEINTNITVGNSLGLPFNAAEYLSGEHSGLAQLPAMPVDNPNFVAAVSQSHLAVIGADASREPAQRTVGGALTVPRHPTAIYYNAGTVAQEIDEYNWLYNSRANGGSGYCEDNPTTATCLKAPLGADGFTNYIVPSDATFDLHFILSNDPRPFYAHVSNLAGDRILYPLLDKILGTYRAAFAANAPITNLTETQAGAVLQRQAAWGASSGQVSAYVANGHVTIQNSGGGTVPITVPNGTTVAGVSLESYGGELSGWLPANATSATLPAPTLSVTGSPQFEAGTANSLTITATAALPPTLAVTGTLPTGVVFTNNGDGTGSIGGTPATGTDGSYPITVTATSGSGQLTQAVTLLVGQPLAITSAPSATATTGTAFTFTVTTSGTAPVALAATGTPPDGISLTDNHDGTATLAGTPGPAAGGSYPLTLTATNAGGSTTQPFTLTVNQAPVFTSAPSAAATNGIALSFKVTTTGFPVAALSRTGTLPAGVTFAPASDGTATFAGTPTQNGTFVQTLRATSAAGSATQTLTLTVAARTVPTFTSANNAAAVAGQPFSFQITTTGNPVPTVTQTGTLPAGITFTPGANGTATLAGTPAATAGGSYPFTLTATSAAGTRNQTFTLTVTSIPVFTSAATANATLGTAFTFTVRTTGLPRPSFSATGLPPGIGITSNTNGTATLSGTPTSTGTYAVTISATNSVGTATQAFTLIVRQLSSFTSAASATATVGQPFTFTVAATGYPSPSLSRTGTLPSGITFTASTGTLAGTPAATAGGSYTQTFSATNSAGTVRQTFVLTVNQPPAITSAAAATWTFGTAGSFTIRATGFPRPDIAVAGALPAGVLFTPGTGGTATLTGVPLQSGVFPLTLTATNTLGSVQQSFTLTVRQPPVITSPNTAIGTRAQPFAFAITSTGVPTPTVSRSGTLPPGVTFTAGTDGTARLAGTPTTAGTYTLTITARNAAGTVTQTLTVQIT